MAFAASSAITLKILASFGSDTLIVRDVSRANANSDHEFVRGLLKVLLLHRITVLTALALCLYLAKHLGLLGGWGDDETQIVFVILACAFLISGLTDLYCGFLKGIKQSWRSFAIEQSLVASITLFFITVLLLTSQLTVLNASLSFLISNVLSVLIGLKVIGRYSKFWKAGKNARLRHTLKESFPFMITSSMYLVIAQTDILMLGVMQTVEEVGIYSVAMKLAVLTSLFLLVSNSVVAPKISELYSQGKVDQMLFLARKVVTVLMFFGLAILLFFIVFGEWLMGLWGVSGYSDVLIILALGQFVNLATGPVGNLLIMTEYAKLQSQIVTVMALMNIILNYVFIDLYGLIGAAWATAIVVSLTNLISWAAVWRLHGTPIIPVFRLSLFKLER
jgi:O-antigen/teichoic acid export membrane protein